MSWGKLLAVGGALGGAAGLGVISYKLLTDKEHTLKDIEPDYTPVAGGPDKTGYKLVDKLLPQLRAIAKETAIPLGLLIAWIAKESGGRLNDTTSLDERGYFQLMPSESKTIGVDHARLSTDSDYSLHAGALLIQDYMGKVTDLNVARLGTSYFWRLVKLAHSMGSGQTKKVVNAAKAAGSAGSWDALEDFALDMKLNGPQPKKWFPFVDKIYRLGKPFGFGSEQALAVVGHGGHGGGGHGHGHGGRGRGRGGWGGGPWWYGGPYWDYGIDGPDLDFDEQDLIEAIAQRVKELDGQDEKLGGLSLLGAEG